MNMRPKNSGKPSERRRSSSQGKKKVQFNFEEFKGPERVPVHSS